MKVAIVAPSPVPYVFGGGQRLWDGLYGYIAERTTHDVELIKVPTRERSLPEVVDSYQRFSRLDLDHFDRVISTKYPAWLVDHDDHVVYMQHTLRGLYDTYDLTGLPRRVSDANDDIQGLRTLMKQARGRDRLPEFFERWDAVLQRRGADDDVFSFPGPLAREIVHFLDRIALSPQEISRYAAISRTVVDRPGYFPPGVHVDAIHHPSDLSAYREGPYDYLFTASRLDHPKRVDLIIAAMKHVDADIELRIAGTGPDEPRLRELAEPDDRIRFVGYVTSDELLDLYGGALAVVFVPDDEDLGLITLEAMSSGKPVVTADDAGGPTELVVHGETGYVSAPDPASLGKVLSDVAGDPGRAREMGDRGRERAERVTWEQVARHLLGPTGHGSYPRRRPGRPKVVVTSTFVVHPPRGGGQVRSEQLYGGLSDRFDVEIVSLAPEDDQPRTQSIAPGFVETVVPKTGRHQRWESDHSEGVGWVPITDIAATRGIEMTPSYVEELRRATSDADAIVLSHPYLVHAAVGVAPGLPLIYDAHNIETELKGRMLPRTPVGEVLLDWVREVEREAVRRADRVVTCSEADAHGFARRFGVDNDAIAVVPNGVDCAGVAFTPSDARLQRKERFLERLRPREERPRHMVLFLASWHEPNLEAAKVILHAAKRNPEALFLMVGSHGDYFRERSRPPNVAFLGTVSVRSKDELLAAVDLAVNPMLSGSGTNLKVLEYFAAGVPVLSTAFGTRGLAAEAGSHYLEAGIDTFGDAVGRALESGPHGKIVVAARSLVEELFDWPSLARRFGDVVNEVVRSPSQVR